MHKKNGRSKTGGRPQTNQTGGNMNVLREINGNNHVSIFSKYAKSIQQFIKHRVLPDVENCFSKIRKGNIRPIGETMRFAIHATSLFYCFSQNGLSGALGITLVYLSIIVVSHRMRKMAERSNCSWVRDLKPSMRAMKVLAIASYIRNFYPQSAVMTSCLYISSIIRLATATFYSKEPVRQYISGAVASEIFAKSLRLMCDVANLCKF